MAYGNAPWLLLTFVATGILQYSLGIAGNAPPQHGARDVSALPSAYALRVATSAVFGDRSLVHIWRPGNHWIAYLSLVVVCLAAALAMVKAHGPTRGALIAVFVYSVAFFVAPLLIRGGAAEYLRLPFRLNGSRYTILPLWFLYSGWVLGVGNLGRARQQPTHAERAPSRWLPIVAGLPLAILLAANFTLPGARSSGTDWRQSVAAARRTCTHGSGGRPLTSTLPAVATPQLLTGNVVALPVPPWGEDLFWAVRLPCDQL